MACSTTEKLKTEPCYFTDGELYCSNGVKVNPKNADNYACFNWADFKSLLNYCKMKSEK